MVGVKGGADSLRAFCKMRAHSGEIQQAVPGTMGLCPILIDALVSPSVGSSERCPAPRTVLGGSTNFDPPGSWRSRKVETVMIGNH
jgi:hypothetical protein